MSFMVFMIRVMLLCFVLGKCLLEIGCLIKIMEVLTEQKGRKENCLQYFIMAVMLAVCVYINFYNGSSLFQAVHYIGVFVIFIIRYQMNVMDTAIYTLFSFLIGGVLELLVYLPCNLLYRILNGKEDCSVIVVTVVFLICCLMEQRKVTIANRKWLDSFKEKINVWFIIVIFAISFVYTIALVRFDDGMSFDEGFYLLSALFIFLVLIYKLSGYQMEIECHKRYADKYGEVIEDLRKRQHTFMNQLDSVYAMCKIYDNYDELVYHQAEKLDHLRKYLMPGNLLILDRPLVVAHLYTKLCEAEEKRIFIHTEFSCSLEVVNIPDIFLIEILGNLLDNAIEEVLAGRKHEKVRVMITDDESEICMSVGNEHDKIPYKEYRRFFRDGYSMKGKRRGVGLPYVKKIVDKFHGRIEMGNVLYERENYFVVSVYFKK